MPRAAWSVMLLAAAALCLAVPGSAGPTMVDCPVQDKAWSRISERFGPEQVGIPCHQDPLGISDETVQALKLPPGTIAWKCKPEFFERLNERINENISGLTWSLRDVMKRARKGSPDANTYLVGGAVRDVLQGIDPQDLDVTFVPGFNAAVAAIRASLKSRERNELWTQFALGARLGIVGLHLDIVKPEVNIMAENYKRDYSMNAVYLDLTNEVIIDVTGRAVRDILTNTIRIANDRDRDGWCRDDSSNCAAKLMRYFHMRMKGFHGDPATRDFVMESLPSQLNQEGGQFANGYVFKKVLMPCHTAACEAALPDRAQQLINAYVEDFVSWKLALDPSGYRRVSQLIKTAVESFKTVFGPAWRKYDELRRGVQLDLVEYKKQHRMELLKAMEGPYTSRDQCATKTRRSLGLVSLLESKTIRSLRAISGPAREFTNLKDTMLFYGYFEYYWSHAMTEWPGSRWAAKELGLRLMMFLTTARVFDEVNMKEVGLPIPGGIDYGTNAAAMRNVAKMLNDPATSVRQILAWVWRVINHCRVKIAGSWSEDLHSAMDKLRTRKDSSYTSILTHISKELDVCIAPAVEYEPCKGGDRHTTDEGWIDLNYDLGSKGMTIPTMREERRGGDYSLNCFANDDMNPPLSSAELQQCEKQRFWNSPYSKDCSKSQVYNLGRSHYKLLYSDLPSAWMDTLRQEGFVMQSRLNGFRTVAGPSGSVAWLIEFARNVLGFSYSELLLLRIAMSANMAQTDGHSLYEALVGAERTMGHDFKRMEPIEHVDLFGALLSADVTVQSNAGDSVDLDTGAVVRGGGGQVTFTKEEMRAFLDENVDALRAEHGADRRFRSFYMILNVMMHPFLNWAGGQPGFPKHAILSAIGTEGALARSAASRAAAKKKQNLAVRIVHKMQKPAGHISQGETIRRILDIAQSANLAGGSSGHVLLSQLTSILHHRDSATMEDASFLDWSELERVGRQAHDAILDAVDDHFFNRKFGEFGDDVEVPVHCEFPFELPTSIQEHSNVQDPLACWTNVNTRRAMVYDEAENIFRGTVDVPYKYGSAVYADTVDGVRRGSKLIVVGYRVSDPDYILVRVASGSRRGNMVDLIRVPLSAVARTQPAGAAGRAPRRQTGKILVAGNTIKQVTEVTPCGQHNGYPQVLIKDPMGGVMTDYVGDVISASQLGVVSKGAFTAVKQLLGSHSLSDRVVCYYGDVWKVSRIVSVNAGTGSPTVTCKNAMARSFLVPMPHYHIGVRAKNGLIADTTTQPLTARLSDSINYPSAFTTLVSDTLISYEGTFWKRKGVDEVVKITGFDRLTESDVHVSTISVVKAGRASPERHRHVEFPGNAILTETGGLHTQLVIERVVYEAISCHGVTQFIGRQLGGKTLGYPEGSSGGRFEMVSVEGAANKGTAQCVPIITTNRGNRPWNDRAMRLYVDDDRIKNQIDLYQDMCRQVGDVMRDHWLAAREDIRYAGENEFILYHVVDARVIGLVASECKISAGLQFSRQAGAWSQTVLELQFDLNSDIADLIAPAATASYGEGASQSMTAHRDVERLLKVVLGSTDYTLPKHMPNYRAWPEFPHPTQWAMVDAYRDSQERYVSMMDTIPTVSSLQFVSSRRLVFVAEVGYPDVRLGGLQTAVPKAGDEIELSFQDAVMDRPEGMNKEGARCFSACLGEDVRRYVDRTANRYVDTVLKQIEVGKDTIHAVWKLTGDEDVLKTDVVTVEGHAIVAVPPRLAAAHGKYIVRMSLSWGLLWRTTKTLNGAYFPDLLDIARKEGRVPTAGWGVAVQDALEEETLFKEVPGY